MEVGARALDVLPLLQERVAALTGGRDRRGGPIVWFPANSRRDRVAPDDYRRLLHYLISIPRYVNTVQSGYISYYYYLSQWGILIIFSIILVIL